MAKHPERDARPTILEFLLDTYYLGLSYSLLQLTLMKAIYGLALTPEELDVWGECTGRVRYPAEPFTEVTVIAGARSGKDSRVAAPIALYEALFTERPHVKGETPTVPLVAQDQKATEVAFGYLRDYVLAAPRLAKYVEDERAAELRLVDYWGRPVRVRCFACTAKSIRGWSIPAAVMDEVAFFRVEAGANADVEVQTAIRRGGIGYPHQRLVKISTPYLKDGVLYDDLVRYWGKDEPDVLVWKAPTTRMNPLIAEARIAAERRKDPARARREYDAEFGEDVTSFLPLAWLDAAVMQGRAERPPQPGVRYVAAVDPSGGGADAFTLAIVHVEHGRMVQDVMKGWRGTRTAAIELGAVCAEIAAICRRYGCARVVGDKYAGRWPEQKFREVGVSYQAAEIDKSRAYLEWEPWVAQGRMDLLDHPELAHEAGLLEKRLKPGGKTPVIDHPKGGHDDYANAVAQAVAELAKSLHPFVEVTLDDLTPAERVAAAESLVHNELATAVGRPDGDRAARAGDPFWRGRGHAGFWRRGMREVEILSGAER